jgi:hypothetical protein
MKIFRHRVTENTEKMFRKLSVLCVSMAKIKC